MDQFAVLGSFFTGSRLEFTCHILMALICGLGIGLERASRSKDVGLRTHCIIACAAALYMIISKYAFTDLLPHRHGGADPTMIACQVVNGMNFLGVGIILRNKNNPLSGLTTATGIWATAAVGLACGCGLYVPAVFGSLLIISLHRIMHRWNIGGNAYSIQELRLTMESTPRIWQVLREKQAERDILVLSSRYVREGEKLITLSLTVRMIGYISLEETLSFLRENNEIKSIST